MTVIASLIAAASACAPYEEPAPTSAYQWQRRQDEIQRRACETMNRDDARYARECVRPGVSN